MVSDSGKDVLFVSTGQGMLRKKNDKRHEGGAIYHFGYNMMETTLSKKVWAVHMQYNHEELKDGMRMGKFRV